MTLEERITKRQVEYNYLTERLRQRRVAFRAEAMPEIAAWLVMLANRYKRSIENLRAEHRDDSDPWMKGKIAALQVRLENTMGLIPQLADPWRGLDWDEAVEMIRGNAPNLDQSDPKRPA